VDLCRGSENQVLRCFAFSSSTSLDLFSFYVEWNEKNQHRSMRQVIELLVMLISVNPEKSSAEMVKAEILQRLLSIISHQSAQPLVKPAFKAMECLLSKGTLSAKDVLQAYDNPSKMYRTRMAAEGHSNDTSSKISFVSSVFDWMSLPDTAPSAGKLLVTFFQMLRKSTTQGKAEDTASQTLLWQQWIRQGLTKYPDSLENIKNYLFPPLFKFDRSGSLDFLRGLSQDGQLKVAGNSGTDVQALLFLAAVEVGKKLGLVDEASACSYDNGSVVKLTRDRHLGIFQRGSQKK
jgi:hypothetical protein